MCCLYANRRPGLPRAARGTRVQSHTVLAGDCSYQDVHPDASELRLTLLVLLSSAKRCEVASLGSKGACSSTQFVACSRQPASVFRLAPEAGPAAVCSFWQVGEKHEMVSLLDETAGSLVPALCGKASRKPHLERPSIQRGVGRQATYSLLRVNCNCGSSLRQGFRYLPRSN